MKKILATILALTMVLSLGIVAFADDTTITSSDGETWTGGSGTGNNEATGNVNVEAIALEAGDPVYSVKVTIPDLTYTYKFGKAGTWDPTDGTGLKYDAITGNGWDNGSGGVQASAPEKVITVSNYSNRAIKASAAYASNSVTEATGISVNVETSSGEQEAEIESAVNAADPLTSGTAESENFNVKVTGAPTSPFTSQAIGTVTITITKAD